MTERIKNIIDKQIALTTGADPTTFAGYDFIYGLVKDFVEGSVETLISNYTNVAVERYVNSEYDEVEDIEKDVMADLDYCLDTISWGEF